MNLVYIVGLSVCFYEINEKHLGGGKGHSCVLWDEKIKL